MKKNTNNWNVTICINVALITLFSLIFIVINGMSEKMENEISDKKDEKQIITDNILAEERTKQTLVSRNKIEKIARDSLKMISSLNK